jgi:hypothetical protein
MLENRWVNYMNTLPKDKYEFVIDYDVCLRGELESKILEIMEVWLSSDIENRMMQRFEQRLIEEKEECQAEINELRNENQLLNQIIKDC